MSLLSLNESSITTPDNVPNAYEANNLSNSVSTTFNPTLSHLVTNLTPSNSELTQQQQEAQHNLAKLAGNITSTMTLTDSSAPWFEVPKVESFVDLFSIGCSTAVIFGGLVPYIPQYLKIKKSVNSDGFSTYVCLTLLIANILRIMFWFGHRFELPLLIQSFVMIAGMVAMMEICIRVKNKDSPYTISAIGFGTNQRRRIVNGKMNETNRGLRDNCSTRDSESMPIYSVLSSGPSSSPDSISFCSYHNQLQPQIDTRVPETTREPSIVATTPTGSSSSSSNSSDSSSSLQFPSTNDDSSSQLCQTSLLSNGTIKCTAGSCDFWDWDDYYSYVKFLSLFTFIMSLLTYLLINSHLYIESLGFIAVFTESMLGVPQLLRNYAKKSTAGMSVEMVAMWLSGDLFKTLYFILRKTPVQFYVCGSIQVIVDILILGQVLLYRRPNVPYRKLPKST